MAILGVTWSYKGLEGVTGGYKGLQGVKRPYSRLQINFFITRTSPETFSWFIFHNTSSWISLNFFTKTMDLPLWKKANFAFFINRCSYSIERFLFCSQRQQTFFLDLCLIDTKDEKKRQLFDQNHRLTRFEKCQFFLKSIFLLWGGMKNEVP